MKDRELLIHDIGFIEYGKAWAFQDSFMNANLSLKAEGYKNNIPAARIPTTDHLILCEHPHVYTLGKSGKAAHLLLSDEKLQSINASYYQTNRGGDITYHGPGQIVGYPILDLEHHFTDLGKYMRALEEVIIKTLFQYGIKSDRLPGATGVWLEPQTPYARKICAMGVKCSRWITMHGFALNVNTDMEYFNHIVPCGIADKSVTSMQNELGKEIDMACVKEKLLYHFQQEFMFSTLKNIFS